MERIVAAVDGSLPSRNAVAVAADLAAKCDAELILVTVMHEFVPVIDADIDAYARLENIRAQLAELGSAAAETVLAEARSTAQAHGAIRISTHTAAGDPATEIIGVAQSRHADMVVVGSRGHGRLAGLLLGSVAQKVVAHASCPVLVVR